MQICDYPCCIILVLWSTFYLSVSVHSDLCTGASHSVGSWVKSIEIRNKSFGCCFTGKRVPIAEPPDRCYRGSFNNVSGDIYFEKQMFPPMGAGCQCLGLEMTSKGVGRDFITDVEKYDWMPSNCTLLHWNASLFCEALNNRTILFAGDSTMSQSALTVMSLLVQAGPHDGNCLPRLYYQQTDRLLPMPGRLIGRSTLTLLPLVLRYAPDILIFSVGPHLHKLYQEQLDRLGKRSFLFEFEEKFHATFTAINRNLPKLSMWFRTEHPGHANCELAQSPILKEMLPNMTFEMKNEWFLRYNSSNFFWHHGMSIDRMVMNKAKEYNFSIIDMSPLYYRPDAHITYIADCYHYCTPGPIDIFARILLQKLYTKEM